MNSVLIVAAIIVVLFAFVQGFVCFLWDLPQEKFKASKGLIKPPFYGWIFFSYLIVMSFSLAGFYWVMSELINGLETAF
jgi:hypothetical protein